MDLLFFRNLAASFALLILSSGCVTAPKIHTQDFTAPRSIAIVDMSEMRNVAVVGLPPAGQHFAPEMDHYYVSNSAPGGRVQGAGSDIGTAIQANQIQQVSTGPRQSVGSAAVGGAAAGAVAGLIQGAADATNKKAENYHDEVLKRVPGLSLRADLLTSLRSGFETKGIHTFIVPNSDAGAPRLRWPARDSDGQVFQAEANAHLAPVDADILMQVSAYAIWHAHGQLNSYHRSVRIGVALYNGRTKQFLGQQSFLFSANDSKHEYGLFGSLLEDSPMATAAQREALLSLVPQIVAIVSRSEPVVGR